MLQESVKAVPEPTLKRLPLYHRFLKGWREAGHESVSCTDIANHLKLDPTQVRKDIEAASITGRPRVGYRTDSILAGIEDFLGWNKANEAFLVGAGSMGAALLGYSKFEQCGLRIVAAFDTAPSKLGSTIHGKHVLPLEKLSDLASCMHVMIGIITVPAAAAKSVADLMVSAGIRAIWNFAPVALHLPDHVIVRNEDLYCSLAALSQKLASELRLSESRKTAAVREAFAACN